MTRTLIVRGPRAYAEESLKLRRIKAEFQNQGETHCVFITNITDESRLNAWKQESGTSLIWWGPKVRFRGVQ